METKRACSAALATVLAFGALGACTNSSNKAKLGPTATTVAPVAGQGPLVTAAPPTPKGSPTDAVTALLTAEKANDHVASFGLVDPAGRDVYKTAPDWERRRSELAQITGFKIESAKGDDVTALVDHDPGLDPFIGLHFAHEHQTWHAVKGSGGWLVDPDPKVVPVVAPDAGARPAALAWATALQACDAAGAAKQQAVTNLLGQSHGPVALCHAPGTISASPVAQADQGAQTADLVAQYTVDVLEYVRKVRITGVPTPFDAYLVPIGEDWKVVAVGG